MPLSGLFLSAIASASMTLPVTFLQNSAGGTPWYNEPWAQVDPQTEYERSILEPYSGAQTKEQFEAIQAQLEGTGIGVESAGSTDSKGRVLNAILKAGQYTLNPGAIVADATKQYFGPKVAKWVMNGGVALIGGLLIIGGFVLAVRGKE